MNGHTSICKYHTHAGTQFQLCVVFGILCAALLGRPLGGISGRSSWRYEGDPRVLLCMHDDICTRLPACQHQYMHACTHVQTTYINSHYRAMHAHMYAYIHVHVDGSSPSPLHWPSCKSASIDFSSSHRGG